MSHTQQQLPLTLSLTDSVTVQLDRDRAEACAREYYDRANALAEENARLRDALKAEQARALELQRELILAQTLARTWEVQLKLWQRTWEQAPRGVLDKDVLTWILTQVHPDKHHGSPAEPLAHEATVYLNTLRAEVQA